MSISIKIYLKIFIMQSNIKHIPGLKALISDCVHHFQFSKCQKHSHSVFVVILGVQAVLESGLNSKIFFHSLFLLQVVISDGCATQGDSSDVSQGGKNLQGNVRSCYFRKSMEV